MAAALIVCARLPRGPGRGAAMPRERAGGRERFQATDTSGRPTCSLITTHTHTSCRTSNDQRQRENLKSSQMSERKGSHLTSGFSAAAASAGQWNEVFSPREENNCCGQQHSGPQRRPCPRPQNQGTDHLQQTGLCRHD